MNACDITMTATALANAIAGELNSPEEIAVAASLLTLIGDALAAIAAQQVLCLSRNDKNSKS